MRIVAAALQTLAVCLLATAAHAAPAAPLKTEIDALLKALLASGCEFERNGNWHSAADASTHLSAKLEHLERMGAVKSAEDFIALAASESSITRRPYRVRCGDAEPVESRAWMLERLKAARKSR